MFDEIPIQRFKVDNTNIKIVSKNLDKTVIINDALLRLSYIDNKFYLRSKLKNNSLFANKSNSQIPFELDINLILNKNNLTIKNFEFKVLENLIIADGLLSNFNKVKINQEGKIKYHLHFDLDSVKNLTKALDFKKELPLLKGIVDIKGDTEFNGIKNLNGNVNLNIQNLLVSKTELGNFKIAAELQKNTIKLSKVVVSHPSGNLSLEKSIIELNEDIEFKTKLNSSGMDIQKFFKSLNMHSVPVYMNLKADFDCKGSIKKILASCEGQLDAKDLLIKAGMTPTSTRIFAVSELKAKGVLNVSESDFQYKTDLFIHEDSGQSEGVINFDSGFDIKFNTKNLDFKNLITLGDLNFKGQLDINGSTQGDSYSAVFGMLLKAKNAELENYRLGQFQTELNYKKGTLFFEELKGKINSSGFDGGIKLNLIDNLVGGKISFKESKVSDIITTFNQVIPVPLIVEGYGHAEVSFDGPLDFWKLNYQVSGDFNNGQIHTDSISKLKVKIEAKNGTAELDGTEISKNNSKLLITGNLNSNKIFNIRATGAKFKLEESEFVKSFSSQFFGTADLMIQITGPTNNPSMKTNISIYDSLLGEKLLAPSEVEITLNKKYTEYNANLFNKKAMLKIRWPFDEMDSSVIIDTNFNQFDLTDLFPMINAANLQSDYSGELTGYSRLTSVNKSLQDLNGEINIQMLSLSRDQLNLVLERPALILANNGNLNIRNFALKGNDNYLQISGNNFQLNNLNIQINSNSDLRLFHVFAPFLDEISGPFKLGAKLTGKISKPFLLGDSFIQNGFVRVKNFVHPFEKINAHLVFSQSKIIIQNLTSNFAGGSVKADGLIELQDYKKIPVNIKFKAENLNLNLPDKVKSTGHADLLLTGSWFPFLLSGSYSINGGVFEKEFVDENTVQQTKQSAFLPKVLKEKNFIPLLMDISINLENKYLIKNSQTDGFVTGGIQLKGPPGDSILLGKLEIEKGTKLIVKDKTFDLQTGLVNFTNLNEVNPELYITATTRVNEYDINLLLQGPAKSANIKMNSTPPLAESEIISLLALGVTSTKLDEKVQSKDQAAQTGYEIGAAVLSQSAITKNIKNKLGIDIQFVNQFDSTKNISVLKATATKKITNTVQATASRSLGNDAATEVKLQYNINKNVSAIGNWEGRETESALSNEKQKLDVFGLDLEFKREFR